MRKYLINNKSPRVVRFSDRIQCCKAVSQPFTAGRRMRRDEKNAFVYIEIRVERTPQVI